MLRPELLDGTTKAAHWLAGQTGQLAWQQRHFLLLSEWCKVEGQRTAPTIAHDCFQMHEFAPCATSARHEKKQVHDCNSLLWVQIRRFAFACCGCDEM